MSSTAAPLAAAIAVLRIAYPGEFADETVAFYARKLADLDPAAVVEAVDRLTNRMRFRPTVADIRLEVAEAQLGLPSLTEAWQIASAGSLRDAPACVREATEFVGGRWAIITSDNPSTMRAQFRHAYERTREQALLEAADAVQARSIPPRVVPALPPPPPADLAPPPAVLMWQLRQGEARRPPTELERQDAIRVLRAGPRTGDPNADMLYMAAEAVFVAASNHDNGGDR
jgi:hypothetical protein